MITKYLIGIAIVLLLGISGAGAFFAHKASKIKPANNIEIRFDHIKKGATVNLDGVSLGQLMGAESLTVKIDSSKIE